MTKEFSYFTETWDDRISIIKKYEDIFVKKYNAQNIQNVKTPKFLINKMIDKVDVLENKKILILFNYEFVDSLINEYNISPDMIYFMADCHQDMCKVIHKVYNLPINNIIYHSEFKDDSLTNALRKMTMKFDLCITNPPYNKNLDLKILNSVKDICDEIVCVHPSMWVLDIKADRKSYGEFKNSISIKSLEFFNGNPIFQIAQFLPIVITHIDKNKESNKIDIKWFDEQYFVSDTEGITKYGKEWSSIVYNFYSKIFDIAENNNITNHNKTLDELINKEYVVQLAYIRGHVGCKNEEMLSDDFYTLVMRKDENIGIRGNTSGQVFFEFSSKEEQMNFLNYCRTDFARFCLSIYKNNGHIFSGNICRLIPWLDFSESWDDEKLFKHFDIDKPTQDYIRKFLPDYYSIRKEKTPEIIVREIMQKYYIDEDNCNIFVNEYDSEDEDSIDKKEMVYIKLNTDNKYWCSFYNKIQAENFTKFINNSKFVKFLISLNKVNSKNEKKLCLIPDMDFSDEWTDEKLFEYFNIPKDIQKYILNN